MRNFFLQVSVATAVFLHVCVAETPSTTIVGGNARIAPVAPKRTGVMRPAKRNPDEKLANVMDEQVVGTNQRETAKEIATMEQLASKSAAEEHQANELVAVEQRAENEAQRSLDKAKHRLRELKEKDQHDKKEKEAELKKETETDEEKLSILGDEVGDLVNEETELKAAHKREQMKLSDQRALEKTELELAEKEEDTALQKEALVEKAHEPSVKVVATANIPPSARDTTNSGTGNKEESSPPLQQSIKPHGK